MNVHLLSLALLFLGSLWYERYYAWWRHWVSLTYSYFLLFFFSFCRWAWVLFITLCSRLLIHSSVPLNLLLILSGLCVPYCFAALRLPSVESAIMTHLVCCGCTRQGLVPALVRGLSEATAGLLVGRLTLTLAVCHQPLFHSYRLPKSRACSVHSQLRGFIGVWSHHSDSGSVTGISAIAAAILDGRACSLCCHQSARTVSVLAHRVLSSSF